MNYLVVYRGKPQSKTPDIYGAVQSSVHPTATYNEPNATRFPTPAEAFEFASKQPTITANHMLASVIEETALATAPTTDIHRELRIRFSLSADQEERVRQLIREATT